MLFIIRVRTYHLFSYTICISTFCAGYFLFFLSWTENLIGLYFRKQFIYFSLLANRFLQIARTRSVFFFIANLVVYIVYMHYGNIKWKFEEKKNKENTTKYRAFARFRCCFVVAVKLKSNFWALGTARMNRARINNDVSFRCYYPFRFLLFYTLLLVSFDLVPFVTDPNQ